MNEKNKEDADALKKYFRSLSVEDSPKYRQRVAAECGVSLYTVNNWCSGIARIPKLAKDKIEEIAIRKVFNSEKSV